MPSQPKTITQTSEKGPAEFQKPYYQDLYTKAQAALNATNKNPFMGDFIATPTPDAATGLNMLRQNAGNTVLPQAAQDYLGMAAKTAAGGFLDPNSNPFIQNVANAAIRPVTQTFQNTVLPGITDQAIAQGAYGGARQDVQQNQASDDLTRAIGDITSNIFYQNYAQERQNQINAPSMLGQGFDILNLPGQQLLQVDQTQRNLNQLRLDNIRQKFMEQKMAPWYGLGEMAQILGTGGFSSGTQTGPNPNYVDPFTQALKIGLGGASTIASMGSGGGFGWWGK